MKKLRTKKSLTKSYGYEIGTKMYMKEYRARPEIKKKREEYWARPEIQLRHKEYLKEYRKRPKVVFKRYKKSAKERGIEFDLSYEQFISFEQERCYYCWIPLDRIRLDRVDSSNGYNLENVVPCCWECNDLKSNFTRIQLRRVYNILKKLEERGL